MGRFRLVQRGGGWREEYAAALRDPVRLLERAETKVLKCNHRCAVAVVPLGDEPLVVKIFDESRLDRRLWRALVGSAAVRVARHIGRLRTAGFAVPELVAALQQRSRLTGRWSCVVTRAVIGGTLSDELWQELRGADRRAFVRALGGYLRRLHAAGFYPQDIRARNLIALPRGADWQLVLVDLDRVRRQYRLAWHRRLKNLAQIEHGFGRQATWTDKVRFLRAYLGDVDGAELRRVGTGIFAMRARKRAERARRRQRQAGRVRPWPWGRGAPVPGLQADRPWP